MDKSNEDEYYGVVPAASVELPTAVAGSLTASGAPVEMKSEGSVFGVPPEE